MSYGGQGQRAGVKVLKWHPLRDTVGNLQQGPTFSEELMKWNDKRVNVIGFMAPENEFQDMTQFMLLPLPTECYFCDRPPTNDVMVVHMKEGNHAPSYS